MMGGVPAGMETATSIMIVCGKKPDTVAAEITVAHERWSACLDGLMNQLAVCFPVGRPG
jgi:hypothetical protein